MEWKCILVYLLLILINIPFATDKENTYRWLNVLSIGANIGLLSAYIINNID